MRGILAVLSLTAAHIIGCAQDDTTKTWNLYKPVKMETAQNLHRVFRDSLAVREGKTKVVTDRRIEALVERHILFNDSLREISGFRVQIFSVSGVSSKTKAEEAKATFINAFPDDLVSLDFISPNYKVRAGAFRTKLEAQGFQQKIASVFPEAYVIPDQIKLEELKSSSKH